MNLLLDEFISTYCRDIIQRKRKEDSLFSDYNWSYDDIVYDESGTPIKVVFSDDGDIPLEHILENNRTEFSKMYPSQKALDTYDLYMESVEVMGEKDYLNEYRNFIYAKKAELDEYSNLVEVLV
jgi:hypothetical protein